MKALSVRQPWAWLIVNGHKDVENRTWSTTFRGRVLIHAAKAWGVDEIKQCHAITRAFPNIKLGKALIQCGGLIGSVEIVDCVDRSPSPWFNGPFAFVLRDPQILPFLPCRGALGFFEPEASKT